MTQAWMEKKRWRVEEGKKVSCLGGEKNEKEKRREKKRKGKKRKTDLVAVPDRVEVRRRHGEGRAEEAGDGIEGHHEDDADDVALEQGLGVVPEVLDDLIFLCGGRG